MLEDAMRSSRLVPSATNANDGRYPLLATDAAPIVAPSPDSSPTEDARKTLPLSLTPQNRSASIAQI